MKAPTPTEYLQAQEKAASDLANEKRREEMLARIPVAQIRSGEEGIEALRDRARLQHPDPLASTLLQAAEDRLLSLPKALKEKAELCIKLAANGREVLALQATYEAKLKEARRYQEGYLSDQAATGKMLDEWSWDLPTGDMPPLSAGQIALAIAAVQEGKRRVEESFRSSAKYDAIYPLLMDAWDRIVLFADHDGGDPDKIPFSEYERLRSRAVDAAESLRRLNESFLVDDPSRKKEVRAQSVEAHGIVHIGDYALYRQGRLNLEDVRVRPGDPAPTIKPSPAQRRKAEEAAERAAQKAKRSAEAAEHVKQYNRRAQPVPTN